MNAGFYIWYNGMDIPVSEEVWREYRRFVWAERKKAQRAMRCRDERGVRCTGDCDMCEEKYDDSVYSLDTMMEDGFDVADDASAVADIVEDKLLLDVLVTELRGLDADDLALVYEHYYQDKTERDIAKTTKCSKTLVHKNKARIVSKLRKSLS